MEWLKLRSVRSTWWTLLVFSAGMIGLAILVMVHQHWATMSAADRASFDPTNDSYAGLAIGQLALGVLGVLAVTSEFSSGMIRATLAAAPRRPLLLAAKAAVLGAVTLVVGEIFAFAAFAIGEAVLQVPGPARHPRPARRAARGADGRGLPGPDRADRPRPGRRHPAHRGRDLRRGRRCLFVLPLILAAARDYSVQNAAGQFMPMLIAENSLTAVKPAVAQPVTAALGFALLCLYAAAALAAGGWALARRDA